MIKAKDSEKFIHEIRNQLLGMIAPLSLLEMMSLSLETKSLVGVLKFCTHNIKRLLGEFQLSQDGMIENTGLNVADFFSGFKVCFGKNSGNLNMTIPKEIAPYLSVDALRLHQVFLNLLTNAVKYSHNGQITIGLVLLEDTSTHQKIRFSVRDSGSGIPENEQAQIFQDHFRSSQHASLPGMGLGLSISKQIVQKLGGSLEFEMSPESGSVFYFDLTLEKLNFINKSEQKSYTLEKKILVCDDNQINQKVIGKILKKCGLEYDFASNGKKALSLLEKNDYDLVLMDCQMPVLDGFETSKAIRKRPNLSKIPIIAMTGAALKSDKTKCKKAGMNDHIEKPFDFETVQTKIYSWLDQDHLSKDTVIAKNIIDRR